MQELIEKIIEKLEEKANQNWLVLAERNGYKRSIEIVKKEAAEYTEKEILHGMDRRNEETKAVIEGMKSIKGCGWIPCSERLPKYGEVVMCCCENGGITVSCITHKCVKLSKNVWFGQHRVIAWQPLPAPYQPKGE